MLDSKKRMLDRCLDVILYVILGVVLATLTLFALLRYPDRFLSEFLGELLLFVALCVIWALVAGVGLCLKRLIGRCRDKRSPPSETGAC